MTTRTSTLASLAAALVACAPEPGATDRCEAPAPLGVRARPPEGVAPERTYAARRDDGRVEVGGFDGAARPGGALALVVDGRATRVEVDAHGRFATTLSAADTVEVRAEPDDGGTLTLPVRTPALARRAAVGAPLGAAGSVPNDVVFFGAPRDGRVAVVRSGDDGLTSFRVHAGLDACVEGARFPAAPGRTANPWFATPLDDARLAVSLFGRGTVAVMTPGADAPELELEPPTIELAAPRMLACPVDLDGDGAPERTFTRFRPRAPQGVAVVDGAIYASFSGFVRRGEGPCPPIFVPGVVVRWGADGARSAAVLPFENPQELRRADDGRLVSVASGVLVQEGEGTRSLGAGGVAWLDPVSLAVTASVALGDFAAGSAIEAGGVTWVASLVRAELRTLEPTPRVVRLNDEVVDSVFRLERLPGGLVLAASFDTDRLHVVDGRTGALDPLPFGGPLELGPGRPLFDGLQIVAVRPGRRGVDFVGPDLVALGGVASRLTPVDLSAVLGP
jgi:hypothetical protein